MLLRLHIRNYALIQEVVFTPQAGLTVITGETGAGKSIVLDALSLALGHRAAPNQLRNQSERAEVIAEFDLRDLPIARQWLCERELDDADASGLVSFRRTLSADGRSRAYINGRPTNAQDLAELSEWLIDIHGQHAHQALLKRSYQLDLLDAYGNLQSQRSDVEAAFVALKDAEAALSRALNTSVSEGELLLLRDQLSQLTELDLDRLDYEAIHQEHRALSSADQWRTTVANIQASLGDGDGRELPQVQIQAMLTQLQRLPLQHQRLDNTRELLNNALIQLDEAERELEALVQQLQPDPERLQELDALLSQWHQIARKHRVHPSELTTVREKLRAQELALRQVLEDKPRLEADCVATRQRYQKNADTLSAARKQIAQSFCNAVSAQMKRLGMPEARFVIDFQEGEFSQGIDAIEYQVSTNARLPVGALSRVASGGELSRMSLAIQVVAAERTQIPTLILDEADVGVGGATAEIIGTTLRALANKTQILCITHVPQVAAQGHHHAIVSKNDQGTRLEVVADAERIREIARMIGGTQLTAKTMARAEEMVRMAASAP